MADFRPVAPHPASAVVLARELADNGGIEVFMVRRHVKSEFVPDVFVFPGGSVKPADSAIEHIAGCCVPTVAGPTRLGTGFRVAALRECFEEAGVLLARRGDRMLAIPPADVPRFTAYREALTRDAQSLESVIKREELTLATDQLLHWAHWITPEPFPKRFDTHFFFATMPANQQAAHDQIETTASVWISPEDALARFERGDFPIVFATIHQLHALSGLESIAAAHKRFSSAAPQTIMPRVVQRNGQDIIVLPDEA